MKLIQSPLRYPGSKHRIAEMVAGILEQNLLVGTHLYEPFAGGAGVSLNLLANKFVRSATWVERDPMLYSFWVMVQDKPEELIDRMNRGRITLGAWRRMLPLRKLDKPVKRHIPELGYAGLFFNRTCFSGMLGAGPIGGLGQNSPYKIDCRFNKDELAHAIRNVSTHMQKVELLFGDGTKFLDDQLLTMENHSVVYVDPPYVTNGHKLYRYAFSKADHERLADVIAEVRVPWLLSYDNHELIRELYFEKRARFVKTYQSLKGSRFVKEILLFSDDFEVQQGDGVQVAGRHRGRAELIEY
jgi:DNA adenine methylase